MKNRTSRGPSGPAGSGRLLLLLLLLLTTKDASEASLRRYQLLLASLLRGGRVSLYQLTAAYTPQG